MFLTRSKPNKERLGPGTHLVVLSNITYAKHPEKTKEPLEAQMEGETVMAMDFHYVKKDTKAGIVDRVWLSASNEWVIKRICHAIGLPITANGIDEELWKGKELFITIAKVLIYDDKQPRGKGDNQVWSAQVVHRHIYALADEQPVITPESLIWHKDSKTGFFTPEKKTDSQTEEWNW